MPQTPLVNTIISYSSEKSCTVDRKIFAVKKFSPVAQVAKIKCVKYFV